MNLICPSILEVSYFGNRMNVYDKDHSKQLNKPITPKILNKLTRTFCLFFSSSISLYSNDYEYIILIITNTFFHIYLFFLSFSIPPYTNLQINKSTNLHIYQKHIPTNTPTNVA